MTNEIAQAFDHPEARSAATAGPDPLDRISLSDYVEEVEIGAFQSERGTRQRVRFNTVAEVRPSVAPRDDDVDRVVSYDTIAEAIRAELAAERVNLLETLAERVAARLLRDPRIERVFVRIEKLDRAPGALGVEIVRRQAQAQRAGLRAVPGSRAEAEARARPLVVHLGAEAVESRRLAEWLDMLERQPLPVIVTVAAAGLPVPRSAHPLAQRRIDLLAIEQNAWVLSGRDPRCVVVDSRTELEWAMAQGRISVWAPSKLVLDAHDRPQVADGAALAVWFALGFDAARLVVIGRDTLPEAGALEISRHDPEAALAL